MSKYLELFKGAFDSTVADKMKPENKPYIGYSLTEGKLTYTVVPKPVVGPADNEIWYTTTDGNVVNFNVPSPESGYPDTAYTVLSNEYINGRGVITCKEKITIMPGNAFAYSSHFDEERCEFINSITLPECCEEFEACACCGLTSLNSITIPNSVTSIGYEAFSGCSDLNSITYEGTQEQWNTITKGSDWNSGAPATYVQCSDGQVAL